MGQAASSISQATGDSQLSFRIGPGSSTGGTIPPARVSQAREIVKAAAPHPAALREARQHTEQNREQYNAMPRADAVRDRGAPPPASAREGSRRGSRKTAPAITPDQYPKAVPRPAARSRRWGRSQSPL